MFLYRRYVILAVALFIICTILHDVIYINRKHEVRSRIETNFWKSAKPLFTIGKRNSHEKRKHIYFLKTHKCGSTSVYKLFLRFGFMNNLTFVLPAEKKSSTICDVPLEEGKGYYLPPPKGKQFDILCHHSIYNKTTIERILPKDTIYLGIVREPFDRFVSAILFFRKDHKEKYLTSIKSDNVISTYLENPTKYEPEGMSRSFTYNRMAYDFGLPPEDIKNPNKEKISSFIEKVDKEFDLVMVMEYFDESLILMKRMLNWTFKDILYLGVSNAGKTNKTAATLNVTEADKSRHRTWESIDYILYNHFLNKLKRIIANQDDSFLKELQDFQRARQTVTRYCSQGTANKDLNITTYHLEQNFKIRPYDCNILKKDAFAYFKMLQQTKRNNKTSKARFIKNKYKSKLNSPFMQAISSNKPLRSQKKHSKTVKLQIH